MATNGNRSSEGYENEQPFCNRQTPQQQQSSQPEETNRCLSRHLLGNQGSQAASRTELFLQEQLRSPSNENAIELLLEEFWISQPQGSQPQGSQPRTDQRVGQSQATSIGSTHSQRTEEEEAERRLMRKRENDRAYRLRVKKKSEALVDENDQLKQALGAAKGRLKHEISEKEELKSNLEAVKAEIVRLKLEIQSYEQIRMDELQDEVKRLNIELESEKSKNDSLNQMLETLSVETAELRNQCVELMQQNGRKTTSISEDMVSKEISESLPRFLSREWRRIRSLLRTNFFKKLFSRRLIKFLLAKKIKNNKEK
ncbi:hypothetical protein SLEP1_g31307 [Rubroshorea leprosula]|uniref:BZIP domain-containing protein n=1 Tax=Rubroshorea leprosula TaxID=152421 RepID=A0AAV5KB08_9ROSI|nr:hypothetical protein SLEP1_g31307 [Rubroshorea leprosula]